MKTMENLVKAYIDEPVKAIDMLDGGHINRSFLVTERERYILQSLNKRLYSDHLGELEHNYIQYRSACEHMSKSFGEWCCPKWLKDSRGQYFHRDSEGNIWRLYKYIPSDDPKDSSYNADASAAGSGLGRLHRILKGCTGIKTIETTSHLHDLHYHYQKYRKQDSSIMKRSEELDQQISANIDHMLLIAAKKEKNIHGDAKISNMIFKEGKVSGFIDLDTIMQGSVFDDIADCARSCCIDEKGEFDHRKIADLCRGYEEGFGESFSEDELKFINENISKNRFMLGIRYYTDYLSQEGYFTGDSQGKLEKARKLLLQGKDG